VEHTIIDSPPPRTPDAGHDPFDDGRALQDRLPVHCFGCGALNAHGLHIKSRWDGDEFVCLWQPRPEHIGYPGYVYGGTIASLVVEVLGHLNRALQCFRRSGFHGSSKLRPTSLRPLRSGNVSCRR